MNRDPIEEKGGINLYAFAGNNGINQYDTLGHQAGPTGPTDPRWPGLPGAGYDPPEATYPDPVGIALCMRNINPVGVVENTLLFGFRMLHPNSPTDHAYIHYKKCGDCETVGLGIGGTRPGSLPIPETKFQPTDCKPCRRTDKKLAYGATDKTGKEASNDEIWDCISKVPTSKRYKPIGEGQYNCLDYAKEAASKCGLDCN